MAYPLDLAGCRFGRLVAVNGVRRGRYNFWICRCDCGGEVAVRVGHLRSGGTKSCGCWHDESSRACGLRHGRAGSPLYAVWKTMLSRGQQRTTQASYANIDHDPRWLDFATFLGDMGDPGPGMTIDRIDNARGYWPDNCRWASMQAQQRNRTNNRMVTHEGVTACIAEWSERTGIPYLRLYGRLRSHDWNLTEVLARHHANPARCNQPLKNFSCVGLRAVSSR